MGEDCSIVASNRAMSTLSGYSPDQLQGNSFSLFVSSRQSQDFFDGATDTLKKVGYWSGDYWGRHASGRLYAVHATLSEIFDDRGKRHFVALLRDVTADKRQEERDRRSLNSDPLTGLPASNIFTDRLDRLRARIRRSGQCSALVLIDISGFRAFNEHYGFEAGDELLREVARRLQKAVRESDSVCRLRDDVFAVILADVTHRDHIAAVAQKLIAALSDSYSVHHQQRFFVTVNLGIVVLPGDAQENEPAMRCVETALAQSKASGRNIYRFFSAEMNERAVMQMQRELDLHDAILNHQFELLYQPIFEPRANRLIGAEALLRWNRPGQGTAAPSDFLPIAEETGLIVPIGDWVLQEVADFLITSKADGLPILPISTNVSPRQLRVSTAFERIGQRLAAATIPLASVVLEISETALQKLGTTEQDVLDKIAAFGMGLTIDNYGYGYSSLQTLMKMPVRSLKIDKLVIRQLSEDPTDTALADVILAMARSLGIAVVADGIESEAQKRLLLDHHCDFAQGFLFSKPLSRGAFIELLRAAREAAE